MRLFLLFFMILTAIFIQGTLLNFFPVWGVKPDLVLIVVVFNAFLRGCREGALVGFFGGLFTDLAVGNYLGMNALTCMAVGYLVGLTESKLYKDSSLIMLFLVWLSSFAVQLSNYILLLATGVYVTPGIALFRVIIPSATYTALLVPLFYKRFFKSNQGGWLFGREI